MNGNLMLWNMKKNLLTICFALALLGCSTNETPDSLIIPCLLQDILSNLRYFVF